MSSGALLHDRHGSDKAPHLLCIETALLSLAMLVVSVRFYSRWRSGALWADDWCILVAFVHLAALVALHISMMRDGFGKHVSDPRVTPQDLNSQMLLNQVCRLLYPVVSGFIRISILLFVRRLSPHTWVHISSICLVISNVVFALVAVSLMVFQCSPVGASFQAGSLRPEGTQCMLEEPLAFAVPLVSIILDFLVLLVPVVVVLKMKLMAIRHKVLLALLLGAGFLACIAAAMGFPEVQKMYKWRDPSSDAVALAQWSTVEVAIGIVTACVPAVFSLFGTLRRESSPLSTIALRSSMETHTDEEASLRTTDIPLEVMDATAVRSGRNSRQQLGMYASSDALCPGDGLEKEFSQSMSGTSSLSRTFSV